MFAYNNPTIVFLWVLAFYFLPMLAGFLLGRKRLISVAGMSEIRKRFTDPVTMKIHNWSRKYTLASIKNGKWLQLFLLIFLNNLLLAAFVSRILYGVIFIIPLFLTAWTGFSHGVLFARPSPKTGAGILLLFFEFGGYLLATVIGVSIGISLLVTLAKDSQLIINIPWNYALLMVLFLLTGAALETLTMKKASKNMDLSWIEQFDYEKQGKELAKKMDEDWRAR